MFVLKAENIKMIYDTYSGKNTVIDGISLMIEKGVFTAIVGTSGSGKTTLLKILGGLLKPSSGKVYIENTDIYHLNEEQLTILRRRNIGFIFQEYNLVPVLNVRENILLPLQLDGLSIDEELFSTIIKILKIEDKLSAMPQELSGGQQQRVAIARALITRPEIILADEPTGSLDSKSSQEVLGLLKLSSDLFHQTIIMITHNEATAQMASRVIHIEDGKILN